MCYIYKHIVANHLITDKHLKKYNRGNIKIEVKIEFSYQRLIILKKVNWRN